MKKIFSLLLLLSCMTAMQAQEKSAKSAAKEKPAVKAEVKVDKKSKEKESAPAEKKQKAKSPKEEVALSFLKDDFGDRFKVDMQANMKNIAAQIGLSDLEDTLYNDFMNVFLEGVLEDLAKLYVDTFDLDELKEIAKWQKSSVANKLKGKLKEINEINNKWTQEAMIKAITPHQKEIEKRMQERAKQEEEARKKEEEKVKKAPEKKKAPAKKVIEVAEDDEDEEEED